MILNESISVDDVMSAIDNHNRIIINYHSNGDNYHTGPRVVEVYAYGLTKAGNPVIRGFQPFGDTTTRVPSWKFFRLDRISGWKPTKQTFSRPASFYYKGLGEFNPNGDETMSVVYKIADFSDNDVPDNTPESSPKKKSDDVYKTDTERRMERLRQQLDNPITLSDLKTQNGFKDMPKTTTDSGPKLKQDKEQKPLSTKPKPSSDDVYKTDTERRMERLRQQLDNPITLSDFLKTDEEPKPNSEEMETMRKKLGDTSEPISFSDLNKRLASTDKPSSDDVYKTDTERRMERLRQQLDNPRKIDLSGIQGNRRLRKK